MAFFVTILGGLYMEGILRYVRIYWEITLQNRYWCSCTLTYKNIKFWGKRPKVTVLDTHCLDFHRKLSNLLRLSNLLQLLYLETTWWVVKNTVTRLIATKHYETKPRDQIFEGPISPNSGLNFNLGFFFFCSRVFSRVLINTLTWSTS